MSVMEMSHRGKEFGAICTQAEADFRALLAVPEHFHILFMQGGGLGENAIVPMNLSRGGKRRLRRSPAAGAPSRRRKRSATARRTSLPPTPTASTRGCPRPSTWQLVGRRVVRAPVLQRNHPRRRVPGVARPRRAGQQGAARHRLLFARGLASGRLEPRRPRLRRRPEEPRPGRPHARDRARRPAGPCARDLPQRLQLQDRGGQPVDVQHAADLGHLHRRAHLPVAAAADRGRAHRRRGHGTAQHRQGAAAVRLHRRLRLLREPGRAAIAARA